MRCSAGGQKYVPERRPEMQKQELISETVCTYTLLYKIHKAYEE